MYKKYSSKGGTRGQNPKTASKRDTRANEFENQDETNPSLAEGTTGELIVSPVPIEIDPTKVNWNQAAESVAELILALYRQEQGSTRSLSSKASTKSESSPVTKKAI